jgi:hypothetical protein
VSNYLKSSLRGFHLALRGRQVGTLAFMARRDSSRQEHPPSYCSSFHSPPSTRNLWSTMVGVSVKLVLLSALWAVLALGTPGIVGFVPHVCPAAGRPSVSAPWPRGPSWSAGLGSAGRPVPHRPQPGMDVVSRTPRRLRQSPEKSGWELPSLELTPPIPSGLPPLRDQTQPLRDLVSRTRITALLRETVVNSGARRSPPWRYTMCASGDGDRSVRRTETTLSKAPRGSREGNPGWE